MKNKKLVYGVLVVVLIVGGYFGAGFAQRKMRKVELGLAQPNFPWLDYSEEELNKLFPQIRYADVPTRVTPEETYAKFRQALKENNLELAVEQLAEESERYKENVKTLTEAHKGGRFEGALGDYPEDIWRGVFGDSSGQICYNQKTNEGEFVGCTDFIKDKNGDWMLDTL